MYLKINRKKDLRLLYIFKKNKSIIYQKTLRFA